MIARLEYDKVPLTVASFAGLAQGIITNQVKKPGEPFFDGLKFYKVFKGYMLMSGCPKNDGSGHPGYLFKGELHKDLKHDAAGVLSMVNNGDSTYGSQFVITLKASPVLDAKYCAFGKIISGMDVANAIQQGESILKIEIIKMGRKAKAFDPFEVFKKNGF